MSTQANVKGGYSKTLTISRTASPESVTTLKDDFLKKTEDYICQIPTFVMNNATQLSLVDEVMFEIRPKGLPDADEATIQFDGWVVSDYAFRPKTYRTWLDLARQLERFFHKFGVTAELLGFQIPDTAALPNPDYADYAGLYVRTPQEIVDGGYPYTNVELRAGGAIRVVSYEMLAAQGPNDFPEGRHVKFTLDDDGRFKLEFDPWFSNYFYIKVGAVTQVKCGFPKYMFTVRLADGSHITHFDPPGVTGLFNELPVLDAFGNPTGETFLGFNNDSDRAVTVRMGSTSINTLEAWDDRLSVDVIATFPVSSKISVLNGKENRDILLARFSISDYETNSSEVLVAQGRLQSVNAMNEVLKIGLEDLCRGNPDHTSVFMLPGKIRHINIKLETRYFSDGKIVTQKMDMRDGTWILKLLFTKKVT